MATSSTRAVDDLFVLSAGGLVCGLVRGLTIVVVVASGTLSVVGVVVVGELPLLANGAALSPS